MIQSVENIESFGPLNPETEQAPSAADASPWQRLVRGAWNLVNASWLLVFISVLLVLLLALTWVLPQLPGQLSSEAGAAERWLAATAAAWGSLGSLLRGLGLFQVMHSPLLQLLLALLAFTLLVHLARLAWAAYLLRKTAAVLDLPGGTNGEPLPIATASELLRWRHSHPAMPLNLAHELQRLLEARLGNLERRTVRVAAAPQLALEVPHAPVADPPVDAVVLEERLLAIRGVTLAYLRPLLPLGMLVALALIWINAIRGWEFTAYQLAPGERTADPIHDLRFEYRIEQPSAGTLQPQIVASVGDDTLVIPVTQQMEERVGNAMVRAQPGAPGLLIQTVDGTPLLARPGQATPISTIGLGFPSVGSEETILLPQQAVGLRIVRLEQGRPGPPEDGFLVEVFHGGNEQAVSRITVDASDIVTIPTAAGSVTLAVTPLPTLTIAVRHGPGLWLFWPALALVALGALGFWQQAGFVLAQIGPWPPERAVVTLQSDLPAEMASLRRWYSEQIEGQDL
jgi:hypothetical protein